MNTSRLIPLLLSLLLCLPAGAAELELNPQERAWLAAHPVIRLGVDPGYAPYSYFDEQGRFQGVAADFMHRYETLLGVRFEPVPGLRWPEILDAARARRLDVVATVVRLPEREKYLEFTRIYLPTPLVIMTRREMPTLPGPEALAGMKVALVRGYSSARQALERHPRIVPVWVETPLEGLRALAGGRADAYIGVLGVNTWLMEHHGLSNLKVNSAFDLEQNGQRLGVRKDWPILARLLDRAIEAVPLAERHTILARWIPVESGAVPVLGTGLTLDQLRALREAGELRLGFNRRFPPLVYAGPEGGVDGLAGDVVHWLRDRSGLHLRPVPLDSRQAILEGLRQGRLDLAVLATLGDRQEPGLRLTIPFYRSHLTLFAAASHPYDGSLQGLRGRRVAVPRGGLAHHFLERRQTGTLVVAEDPRGAMEAVADGRADVALMAWVLGARLLERGEFPGLRPQAALAGGEIALRLALPSSRAGLAAALEALLRALPPELQAAILARRVGVEPGLRPAVVLRWAVLALALVLAIFAGFLLWNRQLDRELARRMEAERALLAEREQTLAELERSRDRLAEAQTLAHIGNWELDLEQDRLWWSDEVYRIFEIDPGHFDASYQAFLERVHPEDREAVDRAWRESVANGTSYAIVHRLHFEEGRVKYVQERGRTEYDPEGHPLRSIGTVQDITERETTRLALVESEARARRRRDQLEAVLASIPDLYFLLDPNGTILDYHSNDPDELYLAPQEFLGRPMQALLPPPVAQRFAQALQRLHDGEGPVTVDYRLQVPKGERHFEARLNRLRQGREVVMLVRDITEHKRVQAELREARDGLERRVAERTAELAAANRELESFSYAVSHDLRAPLRAIRGFRQALEEDYGEALPDGARDYLREIDTGARRMAELIDGLLTLSRSTQGPLEREPVDLAALAREIHQRLAAAWPEREVRLETAGPLTAEADPRLLRTLLENLLENAWKFTAGTSGASIRLEALEQEGETVYCIRDNGAGFDPQFAARLFEPFQRLHRQDEFPGIGIGLATVRRIVQRHGGWIRAEGTPGRGARFCFTLSPGKGGPG